MVIGIDLGTTNSLVAWFDGEKAQIIPNRLGSSLTPSVVSVDADGTVYVGQTAKERAMLYPLDSAAVFKRSMGTPREFELAGKKFKAEELSSLILRSLKEDAEAFLGEPVEEAIISVPAYFNDIQRKATKRAGELAGLKVDRIINEPTAAAIAYGLCDPEACLRILVFDLGGGTFDVSILELADGIMEVHAIAGDNFVGGEDFTDLLCRMFTEDCGIDTAALSYKALAALHAEAERCKLAFSTEAEPTMTFEEDGQVYKRTFTQAEYEDACEELLDKIRRPIERSLRDAKVSLGDIDEIVLVGGATRLPLVRRFVARLFGRFPDIRVNPDEAVAMGAALQCGMKQRAAAIREMILTDVCPFTLGTEVTINNGPFKENGHYLPIIERNTVIPVSRTQTLYTAHDYQTEVCVRVLQGESRLARNNLFLGEVKVPVPSRREGEESVDVTYTYDINSLLEVRVKVNSNGLERRIVLQNESNRLSEEEVARRMEELSYLRISPREEGENKLLLFRGERLYEEATAQTRQRIDLLLSQFERVLDSRDRLAIEQARTRLKDELDSIEKML